MEHNLEKGDMLKLEGKQSEKLMWRFKWRKDCAIEKLEM